MRLGGPVFGDVSDPGRWAAAHKQLGYGAAYCPIVETSRADLIQAYAKAAAGANIVLAEVGAWSNPLSPDEAVRKKAIALNEQRLALADHYAARCCVNISGSRGAAWDGPSPHNFTAETFDLIVQTVRGIIDAVRPTRTFYALETMPNMYPDSADSYLRLIRAIDRRQFAVHLDPTNLICSPQRYYDNAAIIRDAFGKLGSYVRSCHAKDVILSDKALVHLDEIRPGLGALDYRTFLRELDRLDPDTPLMLEHLKTAEEYGLAADYVRSVAAQAGVSIRV
jgi:sugar phosphate isomerase/epimerase